MAPKRTAGELVLDLARDFQASRAKRFAVLERPLVISRRRSGESIAQHMKRALAEEWQHKLRMSGLLFEKFGIDPKSPLAQKRLLGAVVDHYVPAFRTEVSKAGAPRKITDEQIKAIQRHVNKGDSVRRACAKLAKGDRRRADALAAAFRRATKS